jgi:hypothetical protein
MILKKHFAKLAIFLAALTAVVAAPPPAGQLLPSDTLAIVGVPDWAAFQVAWRKTPFGLLWEDPAMTPFREKTMATFREKVLGEMERGLGVKAEDFLPLLQGQVTGALVKGEWNPTSPDTEPSFVLILDTKDHSDALKTRLAEVRQKLADAKKPTKTVKIRDVEFTTVTIEPSVKKAAKKAAGDAKEEEEDDKEDDGKPGKPHDWTFGQVDSVLLVSSSPKPLEQVMARLGGGSVAVVGDSAEYQAAEKAASLQTSHAFAWINSAALFDAAAGALAGEKGAAAAFGVDPQKALKALGLDGVRAVSFAGVFGVDRQTSIFTVSSPESKRAGLVKILQFQSKDSAPTPQVPADAVCFNRFRLDGQKSWNTLEATLVAISPQLGGVLQLTLGTLGKDKDPNFDFHKTFVGNLGDDIINYEKPSRGKSVKELANPPSMTLVGAADAEQLLAGFRAASSLLPTGVEPKVREVNGHKVYEFATGGGEKPGVEACAAGGYVALSNDPGVIDEFLRNDGSGKSLKDQAGVGELAQSAGGTSTGLFGYSDDREYTRARWEALRTGADEAPDLAGLKKDKSAVLDFKLLPAFDTIAHYFGKSAYAGVWDGDGFKLKAISTGNH